MNYFKPAAGIIVLIFVLFVLHNIIDSSLEENRRKERLQESQRAEASQQFRYDSCIEKAEFDKEAKASWGRSELGVQYTNGSYESAVSNCIAKNPLTSIQSYSSEGSKQQIVRNACESSVTESILRSVGATPEQIAAQYQQDMRSCEVNYGQ